MYQYQSISPIIITFIFGIDIYNITIWLMEVCYIELKGNLEISMSNNFFIYIFYIIIYNKNLSHVNFTTNLPFIINFDKQIV